MIVFLWIVEFYVLVWTAIEEERLSWFGLLLPAIAIAGTVGLWAWLGSPFGLIALVEVMALYAYLWWKISEVRPLI